MWELKVDYELRYDDYIECKSYYFNNFDNLYDFKNKLDCLLKTQEILNTDYYQLKELE